MKIDLSIVLLFIGHGIRSSAILESSIEFAKKIALFRNYTPVFLFLVKWIGILVLSVQRSPKDFCFFSESKSNIELFIHRA